MFALYDQDSNYVSMHNKLPVAKRKAGLLGLTSYKVLRFEGVHFKVVWQVFPDVSSLKPDNKIS